MKKRTFCFIPLSHDQFQENEVWIACRVNEPFLFVKSEPYDVYVLMDASTGQVFGFALAKVVDESPETDDVENLFRTAYGFINQFPKKIMMAENDPAKNVFRERAEKNGIGFVTALQSELEPLAEKMKVSFEFDFLKKTR